MQDKGKDKRMKNTAAIIAAAGRSSRMGDLKPLLPLNGETLIGRMIRVLHMVHTEPVLVITGREAERVRAHVEPLGAVCIYNEDFAATDMLFSACLGMKWLEGKTDRFFFLPGDTPLFRGDTLTAMLARMDAANAGIVQPVYRGQGGHPLLLDGDLIPRMLTYTGDGGLKGAIREAGIPVERLQVCDPGITLDADMPEDYHRLVRAAANVCYQRDSKDYRRIRGGDIP